ncbi:MAG: tetratricopeptide repeat protein [Chloroflexi bacterium]|nr:tetratricopeptide repeat protein [Chloroflexota bacterium]
MTKVLEILHLEDTEEIQLSIRSSEDGSAEVNRSAPPVEFKEVLSPLLHREIDWYFQEYLANPFGAAKDRAQAAESTMRDLGRLLFQAAMQSTQEARDFYDEACAEGLSNYSLAIVSTRPEFLALPWELLNEPQIGYLAAQLGSIVRLSGPDRLPQFNEQPPNEQLNVLLVAPIPLDQNEHANSASEDGSPGPSTAPDGFEGLAAETIKALESLDVQAELHCLRPPTFAALAEHLNGKRGYYHLVQFDSMLGSRSGTELVFEGPDGSPESVPVSRVAEVLAEAGVPIALLNSGGIEPATVQPSWTALAAGLAENGVPLVVSVPSPMPGPARELFAQQFYRSIAGGIDVPSAVSVARRTLMNNPQRSTPAGKVSFWDWITPTVYQSKEYAPPVIVQEAPDPLAPPVVGEQPEPEDPLPIGGPHGLVGRRAELRQLERLFEEQPVLLLAGTTGVGKTELGLGFGRWCRQTGARPAGVFYSTFEVGAGLERIIHETGTSLAGLEFADMNSIQQRQWLVQYLQENQTLLVWDTLEKAAGFPEGTPGLLNETELADLDAFLSDVTLGGQTWVLLISRREEERWLSTPHLVHRLKGLAGRGRTDLGAKVLDTLEVESSHLGPEYLELLELLEGHPLAIQVALPLLKEVPASVLVQDLPTRIEALPPDALEEEREPFLTALMEHSFSRMSRRSRTHLPFLSLFQRRVMMDVLSHITQERVYRTSMGDELGWGACRTLLRSAREAGFLEPVTPSVYQINPAFPWFYGRSMYRQLPASTIHQLEQEFVRVYTDTADYFMETLYENQDAGATAVLAEEGNLTQALGLALEDHQWENAQLLVQPLAQVYRMQKRYPELRRLRRQLLETVTPQGQGASEAEAAGAIELWLYLVGTEAGEAADLLEWDYALELNQQLLEYLTSQPDTESDPRTAAVYHQLGVIDQHRTGGGGLAAAEEWFDRSLAIIEQGEDREAVADDYYCLGQIKLYQRRYSDATEWFSKSLDVHQRLQDAEEMVKDYRALGLADQYRFEHDKAESWYQRAKDIVEENRDEETAALIYHELGTVCLSRYQFEEAENWYRQALTLHDQQGKQDRMAVEFHHLGLLAQNRGLDYDAAEDWYLLALEMRERLGDRRGMGDEARQLGVLFQEHKRWEEAERWYQQAREIFEELHDVLRTARTFGQLAMVAEERENIPEALEWAARTYQLALDHELPVLLQVKSHLARLRDKHGEDSFAQWWRGFTGGDPPADLDVDTSHIL